MACSAYPLTPKGVRLAAENAFVKVCVELDVTLDSDKEPAVDVAMESAKDGVMDALNRAQANGFCHKHSDTISMSVQNVKCEIG